MNVGEYFMLFVMIFAAGVLISAGVLSLCRFLVSLVQTIRSRRYIKKIKMKEAGIPPKSGIVVKQYDKNLENQIAFNLRHGELLLNFSDLNRNMGRSDSVGDIIRYSQAVRPDERYIQKCNYTKKEVESQ